MAEEITMRKKWKQAAAICMAGGLLAVQLAGCSQKSSNMENGTSATGKEAVESSSAVQETRETGASAETPVKTDSTKTDNTETGDIRQTAQLGEGREKEIVWLAEDLDADWDPQTATTIVFEDFLITTEGDGAAVSGQTVTISKAGTYVVTGAMVDGQILIDTGKEETVHLVFKGVELSNMTTAPVYSQGKGKVILTIADGTVNTVSDSTAYQYASETEDEPNAPVFVKGDLTVNGTGVLDVYGNYECGIRSKGDLKVVSGTVNIKAESDGLKGRDAVLIRDGAFTIQSGKDGIKANNDEDPDQGYIWIDGGQLTITAKDDGIQAETGVIISGGEIEITESDEGIAGRTVDILGGVTKLASTDDGINSAAAVETEQEKAQDQDGVYTRIAGGEIHINAMADGIDSNGDFYMEGGTVYLSGPSSDGDGILDYNGTGIITDGTLLGLGSAGMMQTFDETRSTQNFLVVYFAEPKKAGTVVTLTDDSGKEIASITAEKDYSAAIISTPEIQTGNTYHVSDGQETADLQVEGRMTIYGTAQRRSGGVRDGRRGGDQTAPPDGQKPPEGTKLPDGERPPEGTKLPDGQKPPERTNLPDRQMPPDGKQLSD